MAEPGPMVRFEALKVNELVLEEIFSRLCDGKTLRQIAKDFKVPHHSFCDWVLREHSDIMDRVWAIQINDEVDELIPILRDVTAETAPLVKTRVDGILKIASKRDRKRYGEQIKVERTLDVNIDAGLLGKAADLLARLSPPKPIEAETVSLIETTMGRENAI